jgi:hypothetical protein
MDPSNPLHDCQLASKSKKEALSRQLTEDGNGHDESQIDEKELYGKSATFLKSLVHLIYMMRLGMHSPGSHQGWTPTYRGS